MSQISQENILKIVKKIRKSILSEENDPECEYPNTLLSNSYVKKNINSVKEKLNLTTTFNMTNKNVTKKTLEQAAQMFTYLNYCPPHLYYFLRKIEFSETPKNILLAIISIIKTRNNAEKRSSTKIFTKIMEKLKLHNHKDIDIITKGEGLKDKHFDTWNKTLKFLGL